jgi:protein O-mannosyl-transferase
MAKTRLKQTRPESAEQLRGKEDSPTTPPARGGSRPRWAFELGLCALLFLVVLGAFLPALRNDFINYDDDFYVTDNSHVRAGFTWASVEWAFRSTEVGNWHPLTWLSHMLDCQVFGLNSWGHHLSSLLIHAANSVLVFLVFRRMTGAVWRSAFVALLFGVHPLHVQSVAWVAERKDVLSTFFFLLTLLAYVEYVTRAEVPGARERDKSETMHPAPRTTFHVSRFTFQALSLVLFALGLMCKPMLVTLPLILLLLDFWPLHRLSFPFLQHPNTPALQHSIPPLQVLLEKLPFLALAAASSALTFLVQQQAGAVETTTRLALLDRVGNALVAYSRYLGKFLFPTRLAVFYPHPGHWPTATVLLACLVLIGLTVLMLALRRQRPYLIVGWLWFLVTLIPVIGLVQVGAQSMADRYSYIPLIGLFVIVAWGTHELTEYWRLHPLLPCVLAIGVLLACITLTCHEVAFWKDSGTLFQRALAVTDPNSIAHLHLGNYALLEQGRLDEAISHFRAAINLEPSLADAHSQLGTALYRQGRREEGVLQLETATRLKPSYAPAHFNLGVALQNQGRSDDAITQFREALRCRPDYAEAHNGLGVALETKGQINEGLGHLEEAVRLRPDLATAHCNLGLALVIKGRRSEAISHFTQALKLRPNYPEAERQLRALGN